jgi:hypothetical protein
LEQCSDAFSEKEDVSSAVTLIVEKTEYFFSRTSDQKLHEQTITRFEDFFDELLDKDFVSEQAVSDWKREIERCLNQKRVKQALRAHGYRKPRQPTTDEDESTIISSQDLRTEDRSTQDTSSTNVSWKEWLQAKERIRYRSPKYFLVPFLATTFFLGIAFLIYQYVPLLDESLYTVNAKYLFVMIALMFGAWYGYRTGMDIAWRYRGWMNYEKILFWGLFPILGAFLLALF